MNKIKQIELCDIEYEISHWDYYYLDLESTVTLYNLDNIISYINGVMFWDIKRQFEVIANDENHMYLHSDNEKLQIRIHLSDDDIYYQYGDYIIILEQRGFNPQTELYNLCVLRKLED